MCYSAQVVQVVRKLHRELGIRLDYEEAFKLFMRRLDDPSVLISRGFEANFEDPGSERERRIKAAIDEHRSRVATKTEKDLFSQKTRLVNAERSLKDKETKKAREDVRIATSKIATLTTAFSPWSMPESSSKKVARISSHPCATSVDPPESPPSMTRSSPASTTP